MQNNNFKKELDKEREKRKKRNKKILIFSIPIIILVGVFSTFSYLNYRDSKQQVKGIDTYEKLSEEENKKDEKEDNENEINTEKEIDNKSLPTPNTNPVSSPPSEVDELALDAKMCIEMINSAKRTSEIYQELYFSSWESWVENFRGLYDTQEAQESKDWYKNYTKKIFNDYIKSNNQTFQKLCGSEGSIADFLVQPDYDAW